MAFLMANSGYIILGLCAMVVIFGEGGRKPTKEERAQKEREDDDERWYYNPVNPNSPNYRDRDI